MARSALPRLVPTLLLCSLAHAQGAADWWTDAVGEALKAAGDNRPALEAALRKVPAAQRGSMAFLVEHMPPEDLMALGTDFLLQNVALAHAALDAAPWGKTIPQDVFLNDVLPYANVSETREAWRKDFFDRFMPLVKDCKTPGEAAQVLNRRIFPLLKVRYSTARRRADQSPSESIGIGMASCTGLSILLVDACRAVGVPARLAGIPSWVNKRGNHTWVEVWDGGWHFTGAAEPSDKGLDHTWFQKDAALAKKDTRSNAIWAVSYRRTESTFPMVWARRADPVYAVNVTDRYTAGAAQPAQGEQRLMVRVRQRRGGDRVVAPVQVTGEGTALSGTSRGEQNDTNDILTFAVAPGRSYEVRVGAGPLARVVKVEASPAAQRVVDVALLDDGDAAVRAAAARWFAADAAGRAAMQFDPAVEAALAEDDARVRALVFGALREADIHADLREDLAASRVRSGEHVSPYVVREVGTRPAGGWPLFIAMHGGGNAPQRVNDRQWEVMQRYYRDQPDAGGYLYLALRAPNNTWNGFYDHYVWPLVTRLIRQFVLCRDVDPRKVFLMGYSHGGYGAFAIGPNIPDRFAAVHASAAAPTPGISPACNLRNTTFTFMIGENDTRYERLKRCKAFDAEIGKLRGADEGAFPVTMEYKAGFGHGGLPDKDKIRAMYPATRNAVPMHLTWRSTGSTVSDFFWISSPEPKAGQEVEARCEDGNRITLTTRDLARVSVALDARLVDFSTPVRFVVDGVEQTRTLKPSMRELCASMLRRGDPDLACTARVELTVAR